MRTKDPLKAEQIRAQALEMLAREGFHGFSMQKLARAASVSPATLYIHFEDREDLLLQLYKEQMAAFVAVVLEGFDPQAPFAEGLAVQWRNRIRFCREQPRAWAFLSQVMHSPYQKAFSGQIESTLHDAMRDFIRHAMTRGDLCNLGAQGPAGDFPVEIFWALAFAPLYELLRIEAEAYGPGAARRKRPFVLDAKRLDLTFTRVLRSLQP
ncbi:TetR/AcrR family transcriptional regulator [Geothrix sp. PMB-07]|uniref:TetR/AcrR family transcriptional regulator n=1 Tax=Geothrix sp. PMB-07 TaxID=3068640 RepID=UPI002740E1B5|nr:TetR/AcrR family transcriptional regulator [Geothrix sp. PMB-07]WLT30495.1 TetR/AcrR family transcriptional regulator [Geothrix sp. PMB-07]